MLKSKKNTGKDKKKKVKEKKEAQECYQLISEQTQWSDSTIMSNAVRLTYAAYKNGQIGLLNSWLTKNKL